LLYQISTSAYDTDRNAAPFHHAPGQPQALNAAWTCAVPQVARAAERGKTQMAIGVVFNGSRVTEAQYQQVLKQTARTTSYRRECAITRLGQSRMATV